MIARAGLVLVLWGWLAVPAQAALPVAPSVRVLVRLLSYDRALPTRVGANLRIAIVFDPHDPLSVEQSREAQATIRSLGNLKVDGVSLVGEALMVASPGAADHLTGAGAVILCRGVDEVALLAAAADRANVVLMSLDEGLMGQGPSVGVTQREARLEVLVDRKAAVAQGVDLSSEVYEIVRTIGN